MSRGRVSGSGWAKAAAVQVRSGPIFGCLLIGLVALTASCRTGTTAPTDGSGTGGFSLILPPKVELSPSTAYIPLPGEPVPEVKQLAGDVLQAIGTYKVGEGTVAGAGGRLAGRAAPTIAEAALPLLVPTAEATVDIIYPQLSGLTDTQAGVMAVFRQRFLEGETLREVTRVADLRFQRTPAGWTVSEIASLGGDPPPPKPLSATAQAVLANNRIRLPDTAKWDIEGGVVDDRVLQILLGLAQNSTVDVAVFARGHPRNVFGSKLVSNHTAGRAVDIWAFDDIPVISQRDAGSSLRPLAQSLLAQGITELGAPWDVDGVGKASFANTVHQDHLHLGFDR